jgi:antitoxin component of MazEF toxin-antitoxin module
MNVPKSKVFRQGSSLAVVLPADWVRGNGVRAGDVAEVLYAKNVVIRLRKEAR